MLIRKVLCKVEMIKRQKNRLKMAKLGFAIKGHDGGGCKLDRSCEFGC